MQLELNCYYNSMYKRFNATVTSAFSLRVCARTRSKPVSGPYFLICASLFGSRNVVHTTWHYLFLPYVQGTPSPGDDLPAFDVRGVRWGPSRKSSRKISHRL